MRRGFTLIELLVAIAIIALLIGILVPTLARARESARSVRCLANLKGIGVGIRLYYDESGLLPGVLDISDPDRDQGTPDLLELLADVTDTPPPVRENPGDDTSPWIPGALWTCPSDRPSLVDRGTGRLISFAQRNGASYTYDVGATIYYAEGLIRPDLSRDRLAMLVTRAYERRHWPIVSDVRSFHAAGASRNALYFPDMSSAVNRPVPAEDFDLFERELGRDKITRGGS